MCEHGTDEICRVWIPAHLSHDGVGQWADKAVDACIAPIVRALTEAGILTTCSCCGHGRSLGQISLLDGRELYVFTPQPEPTPGPGPANPTGPSS